MKSKDWAWHLGQHARLKTIRVSVRVCPFISHIISFCPINTTTSTRHTTQSLQMSQLPRISQNGRQPTIWPILPENCMKMKKFWERRASTTVLHVLFRFRKERVDFKLILFESKTSQEISIVVVWTCINCNCKDKNRLPVADPGFGQREPQDFFLRFCWCSKAQSGKRSKWISSDFLIRWISLWLFLQKSYIILALRWALEALAFLTVKYAFSHFSWYFFFNF